MDRITHNILCMFMWALYTGVAFLFPLEKNMSFWLAFGVGTISAMLHATTMQIALANGNVAKSKVESWSIVNIGYTIIFAQVIVGIGSMLMVESFPFAIVVIIEIILIVLGIVNLIMVDTVKDELLREEIATIEEIQSIEIKCLDSLTSKVMLLLKSNREPQLAHVFKVMYELVRYYDPIIGDDDEELKKLEKEIHKVLDRMAIILPRNEIENTLTCCKIITRLLEERNLKLKIIKDKNKHKKEQEIQEEMSTELRRGRSKSLEAYSDLNIDFIAELEKQRARDIKKLQPSEIKTELSDALNTELRRKTQNNSDKI